MKNFLKNLQKKTDWALVLILVLSIFVRFYNFNNRVTFWSEQARSLMVSSSYIKEKFSLLGQEYFRVDSNGHKIYSGAVFNYTLVPLLLISNYDPVAITGFFAILNILTGLVIYFVVKRFFSKSLAHLSTFLFLFNSTMIYHSLFIWNYNLLPLIGIVSLYLLFLCQEKLKTKYLFWLGVVSGVGVSIQILYLPIAILTWILAIKKSKNRLKDTSVFAMATIIGNLPMVIFDLRHDFYQSRTIIQYILDTLSGKSDASFSYYYLLPFWPILSILAGSLFIKLFSKNKYLYILVIVLYLYINLNNSNINFRSPTGMPSGLITSDIDNASMVIASDATTNFNVSEVLDFDKRAYVLRYFLQYKYNKKPLGELDYQTLGILYVLAQKDYNFEGSDVWEIKTNWPYDVNKTSDIGEGYSLFKLTK